MSPIAAVEQNREKSDEAQTAPQPEKPAPAPGEVVSLDAFRKK
jgi:hypothetical protein